MGINIRGGPVSHIFTICVCVVAQSCLTLCNQSGLPFPTPGDFPNPETEPESPVPPTLASGFFSVEPPEKAFHNLAKS